MATQEVTSRRLSIVSCFVAQCTETVIAAISRSGLKKKYLRQYSESDPIQREVVRDFLHGEMHSVFPAINQKDRADFVRLYACLCASLDDKNSRLKEAILQLYPRIPADSKLFAKLGDAQDLTLFCLGVMMNRTEYIEQALAISGQMKRGDILAKRQVADIVERIEYSRERYELGFLEMNPYGCALLLYSSWSHDANTCSNAIKVCERCSSIFEFYDVELNVQEKLACILEQSTLGFTPNDYTNSIRTGMDLAYRIQRFVDEYSLPSRYVSQTLATCSTSSLNAIWFADYLFPRSGIRQLLAKEVIRKEDRQIALHCAMFQYHLAVEQTEKAYQEQLEQYGDFTALCRVFPATGVAAALENGQHPLYSLLKSERDGATVMSCIRDSAADCIGAKFEETYLLTLYKLLVERLIGRFQREEMEIIFFNRDDGNNAQIRLKKEVESLYAKCAQKNEEIKQLREQLQRMEQKVENEKQQKRNIERKNTIIAEQKARIAELERQSSDKGNRVVTLNEEDKALPYHAQTKSEPETNSISKPTELSDAQVHDELLKLCERFTVVLVDGHENFHRRLSEVQPNIRMMSGENVQRKGQAIATADFVFCKSSAYGSHSAMTKAISNMKGRQAHFILLSKITNIEQCEREIYVAIKERMNSV